MVVFAAKISIGSENEEVVYEFSPHFKGWVLIQYEDPVCSACHLGRGVFIYPSPNPAVPV